MRRKNRGLVVALSIIFALVIAACVLDRATAASVTRYAAAKNDAHEVAELMRARGYGEDNPIIRAAQAFWQEQHALEGSEIATGAPVYAPQAARDRYPHAALCWQLLREVGVSEPVCAGILGNFMAECGGQTLELQPYTYAGGYYGLCMWALSYTPEAAGLDVHGQIDLLLRTLEPNLAEAGGDAAAFCALEDAGEAARYFDRYYERSDGKSAEQRAKNAEEALAYFKRAE